MILLLTLLLGIAHAQVVHASHDALQAALVAGHAAQVRRTTWQAPTEPQRTAREQGMRTLLDALPDCTTEALQRAATELREADVGLEVQEVSGDRFILTTDLTDHGGERAIWRCGTTLPLLLQAPHARFDELTAELVAAAFVRSAARGAMWSTAHRHDGAHGAREDDVIHPADPTRQPTSPFHTTSLVAAASDPALRVVQFHGYTSEEIDAAVVISSGRTDRPPLGVRGPAAKALGVNPSLVLIHGAHTYVLGATDNVLAGALTTRTHTRFLHLELSRATREALLATRDGAATLVSSLAHLPWTP